MSWYFDTEMCILFLIHLHREDTASFSKLARHSFDTNQYTVYWKIRTTNAKVDKGTSHDKNKVLSREPM